MRYIISLLLIALIGSVKAQATGDILFETGFDLIRTDLPGLVKRAQAGAEVGYYFTPDLALSAGLEYWTQGDLNATLAFRFFVSERIYLKARGLVGVNQVSIAAGYSYFYNEKLRFNAAAELYSAGVLAARIGALWIIRLRNTENP